VVLPMYTCLNGSQRWALLVYYAIKDCNIYGKRIPVFYAEFSKGKPEELDAGLLDGFYELLRQIGLPGIGSRSGFRIKRVEVPLLNHRRIQS